MLKSKELFFLEIELHFKKKCLEESHHRHFLIWTCAGRRLKALAKAFAASDEKEKEKIGKERSERGLRSKRDTSS